MQRCWMACAGRLPHKGMFVELLDTQRTTGRLQHRRTLSARRDIFDMTGCLADDLFIAVLQHAWHAMECLRHDRMSRTWCDRLHSAATGATITIAGLWVILVSAAVAATATSLALHG